MLCMFSSSLSGVLCLLQIRLVYDQLVFNQHLKFHTFLSQFYRILIDTHWMHSYFYQTVTTSHPRHP